MKSKVSILLAVLLLVPAGAAFAADGGKALPEGGSATWQQPSRKLSPLIPPGPPQHVVNVASQGFFHFPLQVGNEWLYEKRWPSGAETTWRVAVIDRVEGPQAGFLLDGYFDDKRLVEYGPGGEVTELGSPAPAGLWYKLGTNVGSTWTVELAKNPVDCIDGAKATLASHEELVAVPAGEFQNAVRVDYHSTCMDAGLVSEWFASGVGLVKRVEDSIAGPIESVLLRAKVGEVAIPEHPGGTSLTLDGVRYAPDGEQPAATLKAVFRVHDQTSDSLGFVFQGCVSATVTLVDDTGEPVLETQVDDGGCCACKDLVTADLHGGTLTLPFELGILDKFPLDKGHYSLNVTLNSLDAPAVRPSATAHVQVEEAR